MKKKALPLDVIAGTAIMELKETKRKFEFATIQNATLRAENRRLRRLTANGRDGRILSRASADAKAIVASRWSGLSVTREKALSYGMSRHRWAWAVALLERARVVKPNSRCLDDAFILDEYDDVMEAIERTVRVLSEKDDGLLSLQMKLPKNGKRGQRRSRKQTRK
jgi:hypothetical protein